MAQAVNAATRPDDVERGETVSDDADPPQYSDRFDRSTNYRALSRGEKRQAISIVVIDKSPVFRAGITHLLTGSRFHLKASFPSLQGLPARAFSDLGSVFLVSLERDWRTHLPNISSLVTQGVRILLIGEEFRPDEMIAGIAAGASGYLSKDQINSDLLMKSLELVHLGGAAVMGPFELRLPIDATPAALGVSYDNAQELGTASMASTDLKPKERRPSFSDREYQVLSLLRDGASNKLIARELCISEPTVKVHVRNLFRKLGVKNRTQVAMWSMDAVKADNSEPL